jgi:hypothetical protein
VDLDYEKTKAALEMLNTEFSKVGLPRLALISPSDCIPQEINARFMDQQMLGRLVENIQKDGRLESTPLVCPAEKPGKFEIISGHHRIEAAVKAGVRWIIVMVIDVASMDDLRAKQLSHNSIEGEDDDVTLAKMYESLQTLQAKVYSGLQDKIQPISVLSLSFKAGAFESFTVAFLPDAVEDFDKAVESVKNIPVTSKSIVRVGDIAAFELFGKAIREVKKVENIKASGTALSRLVELGMERLAQIKQEQQEKPKEEESAVAAT